MKHRSPVHAGQNGSLLRVASLPSINHALAIDHVQFLNVEIRISSTQFCFCLWIERRNTIAKNLQLDCASDFL